MDTAKLGGRPPCTVLVVEDRPALSRLVKRALSASSATVVIAGHGARALEVAARSSLDVVILDAKRSGVSGTNVLRRLRAIAPDVPVILVTACGSAETVRAAMELGALDCLTSPVADAEMRQAVEEALAEQGPVSIRIGA